MFFRAITTRIRRIAEEKYLIKFYITMRERNQRIISGSQSTFSNFGTPAQEIKHLIGINELYETYINQSFDVLKALEDNPAYYAHEKNVF